MPSARGHRKLAFVLHYAALSGAIVASLGMLLVPTVSTDMGVSISVAQWMVTITLLVGAVATPMLGRLGDGRHKKAVLIAALLLILAGSATAALATSFPVFLIGRGLQGVAFGIAPLTISIARRYLPAETAPQVISMLSVAFATGIGAGYLLTGVIVTVFDFRSAFWFAAVFILIAIVLVVAVLPAGPDDDARHAPFDFGGAGILAFALSTLLIGISEAGRYGLASPLAVTTLVAGAVGTLVWVFVELRVRHPLIDLRVFRARDVIVANGAAIGLGMALFIGMSVISLISQAPSSNGWGLELSVLWAGVVFLPLSVGSLAANILARVLSRRVSYDVLLSIGAIAVLVSLAGLTLAHGQVWQLVVGMLLFGAGMGAAYSAMPGLIERRAGRLRLGSALGFNQVLRTVGGSVGSAATSAVIFATGGPSAVLTQAGLQITLLLAIVVMLVLLVLLIALGWRRPPPPAG